MCDSGAQSCCELMMRLAVLVPRGRKRTTRARAGVLYPMASAPEALPTGHTGTWKSGTGRGLVSPCPQFLLHSLWRSVRASVPVLLFSSLGSMVGSWYLSGVPGALSTLALSPTHGCRRWGRCSRGSSDCCGYYCFGSAISGCFILLRPHCHFGRLGGFVVIANHAGPSASPWGTEPLTVQSAGALDRALTRLGWPALPPLGLPLLRPPWLLLCFLGLRSLPHPLLTAGCRFH